MTDRATELPLQDLKPGQEVWVRAKFQGIATLGESVLVTTLNPHFPGEPSPTMVLVDDVRLAEQSEDDHIGDYLQAELDRRTERRTEQAKGPVCEHAANEGAYYEGKSYVETAALASLIIQWRARSKRLLEEQPYPGFAGEAEQLDRLAGELERTCNG